MTYVSTNAEVIDVIHVRHLVCRMFPTPLVQLSFRESVTFNGVTVSRYEDWCPCGDLLTVETAPDDLEA